MALTKYYKCTKDSECQSSSHTVGAWKTNKCQMSGQRLYESKTISYYWMTSGIISKLAQQETPFILNVFARHKSYLFINPRKIANDDWYILVLPPILKIVLSSSSSNEPQVVLDLPNGHPKCCRTTETTFVPTIKEADWIVNNTTMHLLFRTVDRPWQLNASEFHDLQQPPF